MTFSGSHVAIIGAGPYGLAAAAHLRAAKIDTHIFGRPLEFWKNNMPAGMLLRSSWDASHISDPDRSLTLDHYHSLNGVDSLKPIPLETFIQYGVWFQSQIAPDLDKRRVVRVEKLSRGFQLLLEDGATWRSERVVVATGIAAFAHKPAPFDDLPAMLVSHSSENQDLAAFRNKTVMVLGGGQSAIESAALLHERGASVELVMRRPAIRWIHRNRFLADPRNPLRAVFYPPTDIGPPILNQIVAKPRLFKSLPAGLQSRTAHRSIRPAGAAWLKPRVSGVRITCGRTIAWACATGHGVEITLSDGTKRLVDHLLLATGFHVDIQRLSFISPELKYSLRCVGGYPDLGAGFESSIPGLHFIGAPAAYSFGPLMRFVSGTAYASRALTRCVISRERNRVLCEEQLWQQANIVSQR